MDRTINVRFFSIENFEGDQTSFADCLRQAARPNLSDREVEIEEGIVIRLERLRAIAPSMLAGQFVRIQSENLPPRAIRGRHLETLGVPSIGHTAAFRYDVARSTIALQLGHNGITAARLSMYMQSLLTVEGFRILPVITDDAWEKLGSGRVRKIMLRIARPQELHAAVPEHRSVRSGFQAMKEAAQTTYVEVSLGMGHADTDISTNRVRRMFEWLIHERSEERAGISKLAAVIRDDATDETEVLTFLDAHMGERTKLTLPDDPDRAYRIIDQYITAVLAKRRREINARRP